MQITIDTAHDSPQAIRKAIELLQSLSSDQPVYSNQQSAPMGGLFNIFGDDPKPSNFGPPPKIEPTPPFGNPSSSQLLNVPKDQERTKLNGEDQVTEYY